MLYETRYIYIYIYVILLLHIDSLDRNTIGPIEREREIERRGEGRGAEKGRNLSYTLWAVC